MLGQKATEQPDGSFLLTDGSRLEADVVYRTVGIQPATAFLSSFGVTDDRGFIKARPTPQSSQTPRPGPRWTQYCIVGRCVGHTQCSHVLEMCCSRHSGCLKQDCTVRPALLLS